MLHSSSTIILHFDTVHNSHDYAMAGQKKILCGFFLLGLILTFSSAKKSSIELANQHEELRATITDVIRLELAALNASTSSGPNDLAIELRGIKNSVEEIKESIRLSSIVLENQIGAIVKDLRAMRAGLFGNHSNTMGHAVNDDSIEDTIHAMSADMAAIKSKLENSLDEFNTTPTTSPTLKQSLPSEEPTVRDEFTTRKELNTVTTNTVRYVSFRGFDELVSRKSAPQTGQTFNGSSISDIMSRVSRVGDHGRGAVIVIINHLDRSINNFKMFDWKNSAFHLAPSFIAQHTKEVFTFAEPRCCLVKTAFSYNIGASNVRIASFVDFSGVLSFGVAFVETGESMENYLTTGSGIKGSSQNDVIQKNEKLVACYGNFCARISVNDMGYHKAIVVVDIVEDQDGEESTE